MAALKKAKVADGFTFPLEILMNHIGIIGKAGSGKTYTAKGIVEYLLSNGERVCVIDPTGVWWGLKSDKKGKKAGYPIAVFGGRNSDLPLNESNGRTLAEIIATTDTSAIINTRDMHIGERTRFFTEFAETLLRKNKGPLHLIIDEAHLFAPQGRVNDPQSGKMVNATNNLVSLGRASGLRIILISQRPAKLHKDSLTQVETLIAMRLIAPQDRKAVKDWIGEWTDPKEGAEILQSLPSLKTGVGFVWSPEIEYLEKISFPRISTYDSSAAPKGDGGEVVLASIDIPTIQKKLGDAGKEILENDPKHLKSVILGMRKEMRILTDSTKRPRETHTEEEVKDAYEKGVKHGFDEGFVAGAVKAVNELKKGVVGHIDNQILEITKKEMVNPPVPKAVIAYKKETKFSTRPSVSEAKSLKTRSSCNSDESLSSSDRKILTVLANYQSGKTKKELGVIAGYAPSSGSFSTYISSLKSRGYVEGDPNGFLITQDGINALGEYAALPKGQDLIQYWLSKLSGGQKKIFEVLVDAFPESLTKEEVGTGAGLSHTSGTFNTYLSKLRTLELIHGSADLKASGVLFE